MPKTWFNVQAKQPGNAEVSIRGLIGEWGVTDRDLIAQVEALGDIENLTVRINSRGGEVDHAVGIFNFLRDHPAHVTTINEGVAMSSGSLILMAGDTIKVKANSITMIHNPWTFAAGNAKQLRAQADTLDKFEAALAAVYVARTGKSEEDIKAMLDGPDGDGIHMTAAEAKAQGFADEVEPIAGKNTSAMAMASALGIPADVLAKIQAAEGATTDEPGGDGGDTAAAGNDNPDGGDKPQGQSKDEPQPDALADQINAAAVAAGVGEFVGVFALDEKITTIEQAQAAIAQAREIHALCVVAKMPDKAAGLIRSKVSLAEARATLCSALAESDENSHTDSTVPSSNSKPATTAQPAALKTADVWAARRNIIH